MSNGKRWGYLCIGTVVLFFLGLIYAWSIFKTPLSALFPDWTISQLSMNFTISISFFCIGGFISGLISKKIETPKLRFIIAAVLLFIAYFCVSLLDVSNPSGSLVKLYIFYGVMGGTGVGMGYNAVITTMTRWFPDKAGLSSGILLMGFALGSLVLGSVCNTLSATMGILTVFKLVAIANAALCIVAALFIKLPDPEFEAEAKKLAAQNVEMDEVAEEPVSYSLLEMIKTSRFWIFTLWAIILCSGGLLVINSAANISVAYGGTATLGMIVSLFNGAGRIIAGSNMDRKGRKFAVGVNTLFVLTGGVLLVLGGMFSSLVLITIGLVFIGLSYGGSPTLTSAYVNKSFGPANFSMNYSVANCNLLPAALIGPTVSSILLEASGGEYITNFYAVLVFAIITCVLWALLNVASKKSPNEGYK